MTTALCRLGLGHFLNVKSGGSGDFEYRINLGPGYRVYFGEDGEQVVLLLLGGTKQRQQDDITKAAECWLEYKRQKRS